MKQPNHKLKHTLVALLLASLTTTQILSVVYSKYTTGTEIISDSARVAKYNVVITDISGEMPNIRDEGGNPLKPVAKPGEEVTEEVTLGSGDVNLDAAGDVNISGGAITGNKASVTKTFEVTNKSEVAVNISEIYVRATSDEANAIAGLKVIFADADEHAVPVAERDPEKTYSYNSYIGNANNPTNRLVYSTKKKTNANWDKGRNFEGMAIAPGDSWKFTVTFMLDNTIEKDTIAGQTYDVVSILHDGIEFEVHVDHVQID